MNITRFRKDLVLNKRMNSAMQASRGLLRKQCGRSTFMTKRSFIAHFPLSQDRHLSCNCCFKGAVPANVLQTRRFSDKPTPLQSPNSNERESLIDGAPSAEIKQLSDDILNLNTLDMSILVEIIQVHSEKFYRKFYKVNLFPIRPMMSCNF